MRELASVPQGGEETIRSFLDEIRDDRFSWTWRVPAEVRLAAVEDLEPWAGERFGDLDAPRRWEHASVWRAYDLG